jgi:hypothetical protein
MIIDDIIEIGEEFYISAIDDTIVLKKENLQIGEGNSIYVIVNGEKIDLHNVLSDNEENEIVDKLKRACAYSQENADENEAVNTIIKALENEIGAIVYETREKDGKKYNMMLNINDIIDELSKIDLISDEKAKDYKELIDFITYCMHNEDFLEGGVKVSEPYYGFHGTVTSKDFEETYRNI